MPRDNYGWNSRDDQSRRYGSGNSRNFPQRKPGTSQQQLQQQKKNQKNAAMRSFMSLQAERILENAMNSDLSDGSDGESDVQCPSTSRQDPHESRPSRKRSHKRSTSSSSSSPSSQSSSSSRDSHHRRRKRSSYHSRSPSRRRRRSRRRPSSRQRYRRRTRTRSRSREYLPEIIPEPARVVDLTDARLFADSREASELRFREATKNMRAHVHFEYNFVELDSKRIDDDPYIFYFKPNHEYLEANSLANDSCPKFPDKEGIKNLHNDEVTGWTDSMMRHRIHKVRLDSTGVESVFARIEYDPDARFIPISHSRHTTLPSWELARQEWEEASREQKLDEMMRTARAKNEVEDRWILEAKEAVLSEPRRVENYVNWLRAVEDSFYNDYGQRRAQHGLHEKMLGIVDQGLEFCKESEILLLEKVKVLEEYKPEQARNVWKDKLLKVNSNRADLHELFLDFLQFNAAIFDKRRLRSAFKSCRAILEHVWRKERGNQQLQNDIPIFLFNLWIRELRFLIEIGDTAEAIASIQASIEKSFFYKSGVEHRDSGEEVDSSFYKFWMSGAPRIGDEEFRVDVRWPQRGGFGPFSIGYNVRGFENEELEKRTLERISVEMESVKGRLTSTMSDSEAYSTMERATDNLICRPLRNQPRARNESNVETQSSQLEAKLHYVKYEELAIFKFTSREQAYQALHALGMEVSQDPIHLDMYTTLKSVSLPVGESALSPGAFFILYRMYCHLIRLDECQNPEDNIMLAKNIVNYAVRKRGEKKDILEEALKLLDCVNVEAAAVARHLPVMNLRDDQPHAMRYMVYRELTDMNLLPNPEETLNNVIQGFFKASNPFTIHTKSFILGYILLAAQALELAVFKKYLLTWLRPVIYSYLSEKNLKEQILKFMGSSEEKDVTSEVMPSAKIFAYCVLMHLEVGGTKTSAPENLLTDFNQKYGVNFNAREHQEVIYTFVRLMCHEGIREPIKDNLGFKYLNNYLCMYPNDSRGFRLAVWMLRVRPVILSKNPFKGAWDNRDPEVRNVRESVLKLARSGRLYYGEPDAREMFSAREMNQTIASAEELRENTLWKLAIAQGLDRNPLTTEKIKKQCFYSKSVQLLRLEKARDNVEVKEILQNMERRGISTCTKLEDVQAAMRLLR